MPVSLSDIDELNAAIAVGERLVRKADGTTVEYRSVADLIRARDDLRAELEAQTAAATGRTRVRGRAAGRPCFRSLPLFEGECCRHHLDLHPASRAGASERSEVEPCAAFAAFPFPPRYSATRESSLLPP